jgi:hypothetical protein
MKSAVKTFASTLALASSLVLTGCGGGGGSSSGDTATQTSSAAIEASASVSSLEAQPIQGQFVDSAVSGLWYETETQSGYTDENGFFFYLEGETVSFYMGQTLLGSVDAKSLVTPLDMLAEDDHPDKLQNMLRILQSLDADADTSNGIELNETTNSYLDQFELSLNSPAVIFEASKVVNELMGAVTNGSNLIDAVDSFVHFRETLLSMRRDTQGEVVLDLLNTTWDAEISSTLCDGAETASVVYNFNVLGVTTMGHHRLALSEDEFGAVTCKAAGSGLLFNTYETDELFACANECTADDLNRVSISEDDLGEIVTTITYNADEATITLTESYFDGVESQTTTTVLKKRS